MKQTQYTLFKSPRSADIPGCQLTQDIVRYAHANLNKDIRPTNIVERNYPPQITSLPSIYDWKQNKYIIGTDNVVHWYEHYLQTNDLHNLASDWAKKNQRYRINDN